MYGLTTTALVALLAAGCGGGEGGGESGETSSPAAATMEHPVDAATAGSITGTVTFTGTPAAGSAIDMSEEEVCAAKHEGQVMGGDAMVGPDGGLAEVFVYVKSGLADMQFPQDEAEVLDQVGCVYEPHILALSVDQDLLVRNSDDVLHNVKTVPTENQGFNRSQPTSGMEFSTSFAFPEVMIPVECNVHNWMRAFVGVTPHPYHAVSDGSGGFSLDRLPPGEYELEAWHELYGTATQMVTVTEGGTADVTFEFNEEMAGNPVPMGPALIIDHETGSVRRAVTDELNK
jgi:hypothetical protein